MIDLRPIFFVLGRILLALALLMLAPAVLDMQTGDAANARAFVQSAVITGALGVLLSLATANSLAAGLGARQAYLMTVAIWAGAPIFAALPMMMGAPYLSLTDAYFEATSGITTTGATMISGLADLPRGLLLWRAIMNSFGGLGIAFVAMIFLPVLRVGGMQYFKTEGFDTFGKALPRAKDIARGLVLVYFGLTVVCVIVYRLLGMPPLESVVHGLTTMSTGGFSTNDASFSNYSGAIHYTAVAFMIVASFPYIRYVQLLNGQAGALLNDSQIRAYLRWIAMAVGIVALWQTLTSDLPIEPAFRQSLFNLVSVMSSSGFGIGTFSTWGGLAFVVAFVVGMIGACSGSTAAGLSVFRVQLAASALLAALRQTLRPNRIDPVRYEGKRVEDDVIGGLILFISGFVLLLGLLSVSLTLTGLDSDQSLWAAWTSLANIGYGMGPVVARTGTFIEFPDAAVWILSLAMLLGRLGLLAILVVLLPRFWRA
ncbi:MAG: TrkH family potassium uptake protein [Cypionkella sp.]|nr:TrkH family potassium uptake protein [Cypionkella sp.]